MVVIDWLINTLIRTNIQYLIPGSKDPVKSLPDPRIPTSIQIV